jgi:hypothetical protein
MVVDRIVEIGLASKTGRRAAITFQKYSKHGFSPLFFVCATSTLTSGSALILLTSSKLIGLTRYDYLVDPFVIAGTTLGVWSDAIDRTFKWYSPLI